MDTSYVGIMLVVFLVIAALAIDIGYMYVSEEDLQGAAQTSALAGTRLIRQRIQTQIQTEPDKLNAVLNDQEQSLARAAAVETAMGKHSAVTLIEMASNSTNNLTENNDLTVGFWNVSTHTYKAGGIPVNAMQVRTRRTAESASVGLGNLGTFLARISGIDSFYTTPVAIAALPPKARANISICLEACDSSCVYPKICTIPERKMTHDTLNMALKPPVSRFTYTSMLYPVTGKEMFSDLICKEMPAQEVCGRSIYILRDGNEEMLRDIEAMMYNPHFDKSNKEYDNTTGRLVGWWVIAPVIDCRLGKGEGKGFEPHPVSRYALMRISRICATGKPGCSQNHGSYGAPSAICPSAVGSGLYIDRISCVGCGTPAMLQLPGLEPELVQ